MVRDILAGVVLVFLLYFVTASVVDLSILQFVALCLLAGLLVGLVFGLTGRE